MSKVFTNFTWEDEPSYNTPLNAENLQKLNDGIDDLDDKVQLVEAKKVALSLPSASWSGDDSPYTQVVTITGSTSNTKVDLQATASIISQMMDDGCNAMYVENNNNVLTVYAVGDKPTVDLTLQATVSEVGI